MAARRRVLLGLYFQAVGNTKLLGNQIDAGGLLGHRMFYLQACIDLEKRERAVGATRYSTVPALV